MKNIFSLFILFFLLISTIAFSVIKWPKSFTRRYWCEYSRYKIIEIGYYSGGFARKRKQFFIKYYLSSPGYIEGYCADGHSICKFKTPMQLAKQRYVSLRTLEIEALRLDNECIHTHNIKNNKFKHKTIKHGKIR